jgi:acyl carrier protein
VVLEVWPTVGGQWIMTATYSVDTAPSALKYCLTTLSCIGIRVMVLDRENLRRYLHEKQGLEPEDFEDDTLLFSSGLIDSFSMVDLIIFIEDTGGLRVHPADVTLDNFDSIDRILAFVEARCA